MKHGKRHRAEIARSLPQWERKFLCYKALKKKLKLRQDMGFRHSLGRELDKVNDFFIDKEEDYIILFRELESKAENINGHEEMLELLKEILAFHSEMVMLLHYSVINFAGLMKIVKKHKKRAGGRVCASYMPRVLQQPFFSTELLYNLIRGVFRLIKIKVQKKKISSFLESQRMGEIKDNDAYEEELLDYEEEDEKAPDSASTKAADSAKKGYVGIHSSGFRDFLLKPELLRSIVDSGFEHPSEVQHECIPQAILGMDVICQAKSGMGKTAVFVLSTLQQIEPVAGQVAALVLCHTRELAYQICHEFERFSTYLPDIKVAVFYGGVNIKVHKDLLKNECPHIVVGTPGRILALTRDKDLSLKNVRHFILDECDKMLESLDMRRDVQEIFKMTPHDKQVMMFSATLSKEIRPVCKKFMQDPMEIYVDDEAKLTLHGLVQHYIKLSELEKNRKLNDLLDALDFNQVVIFVKSVNRAAELNKLLVECNFPSICIHSGMSQEERYVCIL
ncbi:hypothetical protein PVK06_033875 [Gossypium arboreum]|uniref:DEAD-box ATP-dependent RNA helicase 56-like n=2 Tax=Gossypium TaxID=3633 RepID=A0ABR0NDM0_GOSAR|nr:hypothetical protein PVK06_033875 [Gossypium arboreum]